MTNSSWKTEGLIWAPIIIRYALWNLMIYMTDKWDLSLAMAAAIVNSFWGITDMLQIVMKFFLDAFVGNFRMALFFGSACSIARKKVRNYVSTTWNRMLGWGQENTKLGWREMEYQVGLNINLGLCLLSSSVEMNEIDLYFPIALVVLSLGISSGESISLDELTQQGDNDLATEEDPELARGGQIELAIEEGPDLAREGDRELATEEDTNNLARFRSCAIVCMAAATLVFASYNPGQARGSHQNTAFTDAYSRYILSSLLVV
ncbi:hypothetical protein TIFTF001_003759 [Ficus carica]|uniref:Uncharacterized protein n=1 Tax=Ficus carica TaxID=3494 RepID=A0AA87ZF23_FICCA|nr:hypothetical protein TIFTF001_003759 [Ficus carica]